MQIGTVWEGSGNVIALDVLRAIQRNPETVPAFLRECERAQGADPRLDAHFARVREDLGAVESGEPQWLARRLVEGMALALQGSLLVRSLPAVADAFCARLTEGRRTLARCRPAWPPRPSSTARSRSEPARAVVPRAPTASAARENPPRAIGVATDGRGGDRGEWRARWLSARRSCSSARGR